jgi:hypothetical protein
MHGTADYAVVVYAQFVIVHDFFDEICGAMFAPASGNTSDAAHA